MGGSVPYACSKSPVQVGCPGAACQFATITAGASHTCALDKSQDVWCWGDNFVKQLGLGAMVYAGGPTPMKVTGGLKFTEVSAGRYFTCALSTTQDIYCWGDNSMAAVGSTVSSSLSSPTKVNLTGKFKAIVSGGDHACAVDTAGLMYCWGLNNLAQLNGSTSSTGVPSCSNCSATPQLVQGPSLPSMAGKVVDLPAAGSGFTCARVTTGETICWGSLNKGQGGGLPATPAIQWLNAGWDHVCFLASGAGSCWGFNNNGQLGNGQFTPINPNVPLSLTPVAVLQPPLGFSKIDGGIAFTCGISASKDDVYCWGINGYGQLGDGTTTARNQPVKIVFP
jgi:alpha-tubulin suppressor-like RCC1 family protein